MRKAIVILIVLFGVFLAIGCTGQKGGAPNQTVTPVEAVTPAETVTPAEAMTPTEIVTPAEAITPTENKSVTGSQNVTKHISSTQRKKAHILENTQAGNNTSSI
ncbi:MAG TPA: hypothetical protein VGK06_04555 [Methanosarcina sp.]